MVGACDKEFATYLLEILPAESLERRVAERRDESEVQAIKHLKLILNEKNRC